MSKGKAVALIDFGYSKYEVPFDFIEQLAQMRKVSSRYEAGGYIYWYEQEAGEASVTIVDAARIASEEPPKAAATPKVVAVKPIDSRIVAAPSDEPIVVGSVPPMRDFVDAYRDGEDA